MRVHEGEGEMLERYDCQPTLPTCTTARLPQKRWNHWGGNVSPEPKDTHTQAAESQAPTVADVADEDLQASVALCAHTHAATQHPIRRQETQKPKTRAASS